MSTITIKAQRREVGKKYSRALRRAEMAPGVFYRGGEEGIPIAIGTLDLRPIVYTSETHVVALDIEGEDEARDCVLKDIVFDPVTDKIVHFDLQGLTAGKTLTVEAPVAVRGTAKGEIAGGVVQHLVHKVQVECLPKDLPEHILVEIDDLNIGESIRVGDINLENVRILDNESTILVSIVQPRVSKDDAATEGTEAAAAGADEASEG